MKLLQMSNPSTATRLIIQKQCDNRQRWGGFWKFHVNQTTAGWRSGSHSTPPIMSINKETGIIRETQELDRLTGLTLETTLFQDL